MMKVRMHEFKRFNEKKYMYNLMDCNRQYHVGVHVLSDNEEDDVIGEAKNLVDKTLLDLTGKKYQLQFSMISLRNLYRELENCRLEIVIDAIVKTEEEAKELIELFR